MLVDRWPSAPSCWRSCVLAAIVALSSVLAPSRPSEAAECGGAVRCTCGDTVISNYQLGGDLGPCPGHGLVVASKVLLDCGGFRITGLGGGTEQFGIFLNGKSGAEIMGATVKNCRVSRFLRGIRLRAASSSLIADNITTDNGDHQTHVGYGIDISGKSRNNLIENNQVRGSADEGIHIGSGSHKNRLVGNVVTDNHRENLYLLDADGNVFLRNTFGGGGVNSLYLKDSSRNLFEGNTFRGKPARVIGGAHDNQFVNNTFLEGGLHFTLYRRNARYPYKNRVSGGTISDAEACLRFTSSRDNVVEDVAFGKCRTAVRGESSSGPSELTVLGVSPAPVVLDDGSTLNLGRQIKVHVNDAAGTPVAGAQVQAKDAAGTTTWTATTDEAGNTPTQAFITATLTGTRTIARTPITVSVTKNGYAPASLTASVIEGASLTISIRPE